MFNNSFVVIYKQPYLNCPWVQTNGPYGGYVNCFTLNGTNLFAGTTEGVFLSTNSGANWTAVNNGLPNSNVRALAVSGTNLFAGINESLSTNIGGVYLSTNNGANWTDCLDIMTLFFFR